MPRAIERDVRGRGCSEVQSELRSGKATPLRAALANTRQSYSRQLNRPFLHIAHTLHTPTNSLLSPWGKRTGPADGLRAGVQSRLGSCTQRTNERAAAWLSRWILPMPHVIGPIIRENMTTWTKLEVHNITHCHQRPWITHTEETKSKPKLDSMC